MDTQRGFLAIIFAAVTAMMAFIAGMAIATNEHRSEAVKAGVARWETDPETGGPRFVYASPKQVVFP